MTIPNERMSTQEAAAAADLARVRAGELLALAAELDRYAAGYPGPTGRVTPEEAREWEHELDQRSAALLDMIQEAGQR